jgi:hypothetical protein
VSEDWRPYVHPVLSSSILEGENADLSMNAMLSGTTNDRSEKRKSALDSVRMRCESDSNEFDESS